MTEPEKIKTTFSSSNYFDFDSGAESLNMLSASSGYKDLNLSLGLGVDSSYKLSSGNQDVKNKPALEAKLKYNINDNLNTQARFRKIGDAEQYRVTFGGSYKFDKNNSIYSSVHLTTKNSNGNWNSNTGAWIGYTHNFKKASVSAEFQQNIPFNRKINSSDSMINVIVSVPF